MDKNNKKDIELNEKQSDVSEAKTKLEYVLSRDIFKQEYLILDLDVKTPTEVFDAVDKLCFRNAISNIAGAVAEGLKNREKEFSTGLEDGFAIPHCTIPEIISTAVVVCKLKRPINWKSLDGKKTNFVVCLLSNSDKERDNRHIELLSTVAKHLLVEKNKEVLKKSTSYQTIAKALLSFTPQEIAKNKKVEGEKKPLIVGITACTVGIAHTFIASDKLKAGAEALGYRCRVETQGADGVSDELTPSEINEAVFVILAVDINVEEDRFAHKKVFKCPTRTVIKDPTAVIKQAIKVEKKHRTSALKAGLLKPEHDDDKDDIFSTKNKQGIIKHLLFGVSYMIPVVILGGLLLALGLGLSKAINGPNYNIADHPGSFWAALNNIGVSSFQLMIAVLGGFIAVSIGGKSALAPALVVSFVGNDNKFFSKWLFNITNTNVPSGGIAPMGFVGSLIAGFAIGYTVKWMRTWKIPKSLRPIMPIIVIPVLCGAFYGLIFIFLLGALVGYVTSVFQEWISNAWGGSSGSGKTSIAVGVSLGLLIGAMAGFDVGGPVNKTAFLTCVFLISEKVYTPMGAMGEAIPVAPLGMGFAAFMFRKRMPSELKPAGIGALIMGFIGISEGSIPFILSKPKQAVFSNVLTSALAGALGGWYGTSFIVAQGGPIVVLLGATGRTANGVQNIGYNNWQAILVNLSIMLGAGLLNGLIFGSLISISSTSRFSKQMKRWEEQIVHLFTKKAHDKTFKDGESNKTTQSVGLDVTNKMLNTRTTFTNSALKDIKQNLPAGNNR